MEVEVDMKQEQEDKQRITRIWHDIRDSKIQERKIPIIQSYLKTLNKTKTLNFRNRSNSL